ncbi:Variant-specific surface protein [Giardia duodenalis]|uniref:Variant-specific surface protein n=1 Tax=Giardia intestinalis TaxID=5741 RepID=V6U3U6_GIAIN|nr:Variant-specific surface protein [Giardia intestinalis]
MLATYFAVGALAAVCKNNDNNCVTGQCDTVGETEICTRCAATYVPINGQCVAANGVQDKCKAADDSASNQVCGKCLLQTFMYKGGCYEGSNEIGQIICEAIGSEAGKCQTCSEANGYFRNPEAAATVDSCISCGDASGVTIPGSNGNTYKGVANCATCQPPEAATPGNNQQKVATCTACVDGYYDNDCSQRCNSPCITCSGAAATCTKCGGDTAYLKKDSGTCLSADACRQAGAFFPSETLEDSTKVCKACHGDCAACTGTLETDCTKCKAGNSKDYLKVLDAEDGSGQCVATEEECKSEATYFLVTDTNANTKTCYPCEASSRGGVTNCLTCTASGTAATATCTACRDGYTLDSQANTCASTGANRSGLSTGAIAEISVAAVVVVGGLVGFLCWWYTPRGATRNVISLHSTVDQ